MKKLILMILLIIGVGASAQYPTPLPSSGTITMQQVIDWMTASGELSGSSPPYTLLFLHNRSNLEGTSVYLTKWYGYGSTFAKYSTPASTAVEDPWLICNRPYTQTLYYDITPDPTFDLLGARVFLDNAMTIPAPVGAYHIQTSIGVIWLTVFNNPSLGNYVGNESHQCYPE